MARKQTQQLIEETSNDFARLQTELESAIQTRDEYNRLLRNARERLARREETTLPDDITRAFVENMKRGEVPEAVLMRSIDAAIEVNKEFDDRTYKIYLYKVANDKSIYKYFINGSGWNTRLDFQIIFESVAGDLNDWGQGISAYREEVLQTKGLSSEQSGERATEFFYDMVYGTALHGKTISGRLASTDGVAPFWRILESGTQPLSSDRPGGYNPVPSVPTAFVEDAEFAIEDEFRQMLNKAYNDWYEETQEIKKVIQEHEEKRDEFSQQVKDLRTDMRLNERILRSFKDKQEYIDRDILARAIRSMENDERFKTRDVNIAKAGSGLDIIITLKKLEGTIEY